MSWMHCLIGIKMDLLAMLCSVVINFFFWHCYLAICKRKLLIFTSIASLKKGFQFSNEEEVNVLTKQALENEVGSKVCESF
jgi:hypothetical protein